MTFRVNSDRSRCAPLAGRAGTRTREASRAWGSHGAGASTDDQNTAPFLFGHLGFTPQGWRGGKSTFSEGVALARGDVLVVHQQRDRGVVLQQYRRHSAEQVSPLRLWVPLSNLPHDDAHGACTSPGPPPPNFFFVSSQRVLPSLTVLSPFSRAGHVRVPLHDGPRVRNRA